MAGRLGLDGATTAALLGAPTPADLARWAADDAAEAPLEEVERVSLVLGTWRDLETLHGPGAPADWRWRITPHDDEWWPVG